MTDYAARRLTMVDTQIRPSDVTKFPIIDAMLAVPRELFVPQEKAEVAYLGENLDLGGGRVLLEPRTFGKMLDRLAISRDDLVLDVGAAQGYSSAVMSRLAEAVIALEEDASLSGDSQQVLADIGADNVVLHEGKLTEGAANLGPFDVIVLEGAVGEMPKTLTDQLKEGGRIMAIFADARVGVAKIGYKIDGEISWRPVFDAWAPVLPGFEKRTVFAL